MPRIRNLLLLSVLAVGGALAAQPGQALASHGQQVYFEASNDLLSPSLRPKALEQMEHVGVKALRVELYWESVAPGASSATRPSFEAENPDSYHWGQYEAVLAEAKKLGWPVLLTVTSPVPRWATSNRKAPYITRPDDQDFKEFMVAVARKFGSEVSLFAIWNEPNHPAFLLPQFKSDGAPASPRIYRGLYQYGYAGLVAGGIAHPRVLFGETAPYGYESVKSLLRREGSRALASAVAPLTFLRESLCLNARYRKASSCGKLQMTGYAHHPYTVAVPPSDSEVAAGDVTIGVLGRLEGALDKAAAAHAIPAGLPIYLTEYGVQSYPNKELGVAPSVQAEYDALAEHIAYDDPRVAAFSQYLLRDDAVKGKQGASAHGGEVGFQTGLEYASGLPKPLYYAWPLPLTVNTLRHGVALWGLVRPASGATKLTVRVKARHAKKYRTLRTITANAAGYWGFDSAAGGETWRVQWKSAQGVLYEGPPIHAR